MRRLLKTDGQPIASWVAFTQVERVIVIVASIACGIICVWIGRLLGVPREPGFAGSLLAGSAPALGLIVVLSAMVLCTGIAWVVAILIDDESGLFCCCMGLAALGARCGAIRPVLQYASGSGVFLLMLIEVVVLGAVLWGVRWILSRQKADASHPIQLTTPTEVTDAPLTQKVLVTAVQVAVMAVCELILIQSDAKPQAMAGAMVAGFLGAVAAYMFTGLPSGVWYWIGPVIVGVLGYGIALFSGGNLIIGDVQGWAAALARPTPLNYAGVGTAGALLGYWCSRRWAQPEEVETEPMPAAQ